MTTPNNAAPGFNVAQLLVAMRATSAFPLHCNVVTKTAACPRGYMDSARSRNGVCGGAATRGMGGSRRRGGSAAGRGVLHKSCAADIAKVRDAINAGPQASPCTLLRKLQGTRKGVLGCP